MLAAYSQSIVDAGKLSTHFRLFQRLMSTVKFFFLLVMDERVEKYLIKISLFQKKYAIYYSIE